MIEIVDLPPDVMVRFTGMTRADMRLMPHIAKMALVADEKVRGDGGTS